MSGSERNDGSDSMFSLVIGEGYVHRAALACAALLSLRLTPLILRHTGPYSNGYNFRVHLPAYSLGLI
jgi:hypothetical protein